MQLHTMWTPKFSNLQLVKNDNIQRKYFKIVYDSLVIFFFTQINTKCCHFNVTLIFSFQSKGRENQLRHVHEFRIIYILQSAL